MSANVPRPPRPPRPGAKTNQAPAPRPGGGIKPGGAAPAGGGFGDTRTVILSRKSMSMMQTKKGDEEAAPAAAAPAPVAAEPAMPKAKVTDGIVYCTKCPSNFPIVSDEYYGAIVECPDCAAEFMIPNKDEVEAAPAPAAKPAPAPAAKPAAKSAPASKSKAPSGAKSKAKSSGATAKGEAAKPQKKAASKKKAARNVPSFIQSEVKDSEEVVFCDVKDMGSGASAGIVGGAIALVGGVAAPFVATGPVAAGIAGGVGLVGIIVGMVMGKKVGGKVAVALTDERVISRPENGSWIVQSDID